MTYFSALTHVARTGFFAILISFAAALGLLLPYGPAYGQAVTPTASGTMDANGVYTVQSGDTLYGIASRYGISVAELANANGLQGGAALRVGQPLQIPGQMAQTQASVQTSVQPLTAAPARLGTHTVVSGDTLYSIARQYGVDVNALIAANGNVNPSALSVGQSLIIPGLAAQPAPQPVAQPLIQTHTVTAGQTLYAIARQYGVDVNALIAANGNLDPSQLSVGQVLQIPGGVPNGSGGVTPIQIANDGVDVTDPTSQVYLGAVNDVPLPGERTVTSQRAEPLPSTGSAGNTNGDVTSATTVPVTTAPSTRVMLPAPPPRRSSKFHWPARGKILTRYGNQSDGRQSDGIEIAVTPNQNILAAEDGVIAFAGTGMVGFGHVVVIEHADGYHTAYTKNSSVTVKRGQVVQRGQTIAKGGKDGRLHFEVRHNSEPVNPITYMVAY